MSKKSTQPEEKLAEGKKASKAANKKAADKKLNAEAKRLGEKAVMEIAANMPAGDGNAFIATFNKYVKAVAGRRAAAKLVSNVRSEFKSFKVDMRAFDRVFKLFEMDAQDAAALKATEALYEKQIGLKLSPEQEAILTNIQVERENSRAAMSELNGGTAGKEVGTDTVGSTVAATGAAEGEEHEEGGTLPPAIGNMPAVTPARNDSIGKGFRDHDKVAAAGASNAIN